MLSIEKFHFSFNAITSSRSSGGISGLYSSFGRQVFGASDSNEVGKIVSDLLAKLRDREPAPSEFDAGFEQIVYTKSQSSQKSLVQYILRKVAVYERQPTLGESDDLTIEHLMPQSSSNNGIPEYVVGQIGNLMLVDTKTNNELASKSYVEKKEILLRRGYKLPELLLNSDHIDAALIQANTDRISTLARDSIWKL